MKPIVQIPMRNTRKPKFGAGAVVNTGKLGSSGKQRSLLAYFSKSLPIALDSKVPAPPQALGPDISGGGAKVAKLNKHFASNSGAEEDEEESMESRPKKIKRYSGTGAGAYANPGDATIQTCKSVFDEETTKDQQRLLAKSNDLHVLDPNMGLSWFIALEKEFDKTYFKKLNDYVQNSRARGTVYPPLPKVWEWTRHTAISDIKVVILGQDPYHGPDQAHGLCFSVLNVAPPPSLVNIYKELETDIGQNFKKPNHGCLSGWASQGVLLLNSVLTVNAGQANSHKGQGWEKLTDAVISWISENLTSVVFLLWGAHAQKKAIIVDKKKHHLLQTVHPSPLSCHRGFFGCKHFSKCNELLEKSGKKPIDWNHLPKPLSN